MRLFNRSQSESVNGYHLDTIGVLALLGVIACWSSVPVMLRGLTDAIDPWTANAIRYPLSAMLYWPVLVFFHRRGTLTAGTIRQCMIPAASAFVGQIFWAMTPYYLPASAIGFLIRLTMVFSILFALLLIPDERRLLRIPQFYLGLVISTVGFLLLALAQHNATEPLQPVGIVVISICSLCMGFYAVSVRLCMQHINPLLSFGIVAQMVALGVLVCAIFQGDWHVFTNLTPSNWMLLLLSSILGIATAHTLMYTSVLRLGTSLSASVQNLTPFVTVVLALLFLGESLSGMQWIGGLAIVIGVLWLLKSHAILMRNAG
jgi:drug/metabolite transporter (DMT)-like permease